MSAKKKFAMAVAAILVGAMLTAPVQAAETLKLSEVSHLHGIAVDPTDPARLYLASHHGVWLTNPDGTATRVSDNRHDYMGFTPNPTQPGAFYASGHPETGGNLGVLVSTDGAKTWKQVSTGVSGPVDFHSMDASPTDPQRLYAVTDKSAILARAASVKPESMLRSGLGCDSPCTEVDHGSGLFV
jgi:photosystem II stability/assembly factor-like uncharacterized protein